MKHGGSMALRVVRDRTQLEERAFEILQAQVVVMRLLLRPDPFHGTMPRWEAILSVTTGVERWARFSGRGPDPTTAYSTAAQKLVDARPLGKLPTFTAKEWAVIRRGLEEQGAFVGDETA